MVEQQIEIRMAMAAFGTKVIIDGVEIQRVRSVRFEHKAGDVPTLQLEIVQPVGKITGVGKLVDSTALGDVYKKWTLAEVK